MRPRSMLPLAPLLALAGAFVAVRSPRPIAPEPAAPSAPSAPSTSSAPGARALPEPGPVAPAVDDLAGLIERMPTLAHRPPEPVEEEAAPDPRFEQDDLYMAPETRALAVQLEALSAKLEVDDAALELRPASRALLRKLKPLVLQIVEARVAEAQRLLPGEPLPGRGLDAFFRGPLSFHDNEECNQGRRENFDPIAGVQARGAQGGRVQVVRVSFAVPGGSDDMLVVFDRSSGEYRLSMVVASDDLRLLRDAISGSRFSVQPAGDGYRLALSHQQISFGLTHDAWFRVLTPSSHPRRPVALVDERMTILSNSEFVFSEADGALRLEAFASARLAPAGGHFLREHVRAFAEVDGKLQRVAPWVTRPEDAPDEWLRLPWAEARRLSGPGLRCLEQRHRRLHGPDLMSEFTASRGDGGEVRLVLNAQAIAFVVSETPPFAVLDVVIDGQGCR